MRNYIFRNYIFLNYILRYYIFATTFSALLHFPQLHFPKQEKYMKIWFNEMFYAYLKFKSKVVCLWYVSYQISNQRNTL